MDPSRNCPDCSPQADRREFLRASAAVGAAAATAAVARAEDAPKKPASKPESLVKKLFDSLSDKQRSTIAFDWDYQHEKLGLLRTRISNNWHITSPTVTSDFYTKDQQEIARAIWEGIIHPDWHKRVDKQIQDDNGGKPWGASQNIAIFGKPGEGKYELVMTGRHMTIRCDGDSSEHVAFGGPIFYGHAASGFNEKPGHPGNVYWEQALTANAVYGMLDGEQRKKATGKTPLVEEAVGFQGAKGKFPGIAVRELSSDQKELVQKTLQKLIEPYRQSDQDEVVACLKAQGGLDACSLAFFNDEDLGQDEVWDNWRLEGPSFVWYFRGVPHVHVWVNVASDPSVKLNA